MSPEFEWDAAKEARNKVDHGVTFEMSRDVFRDPFSIEWLDDREDYSEGPLCDRGHGRQPFALCRLRYEG
jgi:uncharacterized DUF497 family protein